MDGNLHLSFLCAVKAAGPLIQESRITSDVAFKIDTVYFGSFFPSSSTAFGRTFPNLPQALSTPSADPVIYILNELFSNSLALIVHRVFHLEIQLAQRLV